MRYFTKLCVLAFFGVLLWMPVTANAQGIIGSCDPAIAENYLDINNVRARIPNNGELFYRGEPHVYNVPKTTTSNALFASGIWVGGQTAGQLRMAATRYGPYEFWAGPLSDNGDAPLGDNGCDPYDRSYKINRSDINNYDAGGSPTPDLADWPTGLGAPTLDAEGNLIDLLDQPLTSRQDRVIDLAAGERPAILGDQMIWWVMNDMGNTHEASDSPPIGLEVHALVFAFDVAGDIGNATFYKYKLFYKGAVPLENAYMSIFSDPDLGDAGDDYVGSDVELGMGYVYNSDNDDTGGEGYGAAPPAVGYDFFQGPIVPSPGDTAHVSGVPVPDFKNLQMTSFVYYNNGGGPNEDPQTAEDYYGYMQAKWKNGNPILYGGDGFESNVTSTPTSFMYDGDPVQKEYWSELNTDGAGSVNTPADRRFVLTSGPFTINPGDVQEIVFGIPYGRGADNLLSINALRDADALAQAAFDVQFDLPSAPARPDVTWTELDNKVVIEWSNKPTSNNYLESYTSIDPFAPLSDPDYQFEGYRIYQFTENADLQGTVIATFDVDNGVTQVIDGFPGQPTSIVMNGNDGGAQTYAVIDGLTNYQTYHFGVQAFAYNEGSYPKIFGSPIVRFDAQPRRSENVISEAAKEKALTTGDESDFEVSATQVGAGIVSVDIVNPAVVIEGATYTVEFYNVEVSGKRETVSSVNFNTDELVTGEENHPTRIAAKTAVSTAVTYDIKRDGTVIFNGNLENGVAPQRKNVIVLDGLQFSVTGPEPNFKDFLVVQNESGPVQCSAAVDFQGYPNSLGNPGDGGCDANWAIGTGSGGPAGSYDGFLEYSVLGRAGWDPIVPYDFEFRFTGTSLFYNYFVDDTVNDNVPVPFEVWNIGIATPDDPSDDYRLIIAPLNDGGAADAWDLRVRDHPGSGSDNDPYTDRFYIFNPSDTSPGSVGYDAWAADAVANNDGYTDLLGNEVMGRVVFWNWNGGDVSDYIDAGCDPDVYDPTCVDADGDDMLLGAPRPADGTIFRILTLKPNQPGDVFTFNTTGFGVQPANAELKKDQLKEIGVVPNPYKGASIYERSQLIDEVRFTNLLSEETTVRIFALNGTLIREFTKPAGSRTLTWSLTTDNNLPIASGLYLIHFDVQNVGETVVKFAVVRKRTQLDVF